MELHASGWKNRSGQDNSGPMTIQEVHAQAAREHQEAARAAMNASLPGMSRGDASSRGGSRRGDQRGFAGANDQWSSVGNRPPAKAADMSSFGKISKGGPAFLGPSGVFSKNKGPGETTPPSLSRTGSSSNMFSVLGSGGAADASPETAATEPVAVDAGAGRKKLVLAPRSSKTEAAESEPAAEENAVDFEKKMKADRDEFWGVKDTIGTRNPKDVVEFFSALPESQRSELAKAFVDDVFRLAKKADTDLVAKAFGLAVDAGVLKSDDVKAGLLPSIEQLDDLSVDVPQAFSFAAQLMVATKLPQADIEDLASKIVIEYEPKVHPKDKLLNKVKELQESSA